MEANLLTYTINNKKYRQKRKELHMVITTQVKARDMVHKDLILWVLDKKNILRGYDGINKDMYKGAIMRVRITYGETGKFPITIGLHQRQGLSPYFSFLFFFQLIMDELTAHTQEEVPQSMLFVNDIIFLDESRDDKDEKLNRWRETLESMGIKVCHKKRLY